MLVALTTRGRIVAVLVVLMGLAQGARADENPSGPYVGAAYGQFNVKVDDLEGAQDIIGEIDTDDSAFKVFFGWRFNPYIALEGAYIDLGNPRGDFTGSGSDGQYEAEFAGFAPYLIGSFPITIFELSAKVGYYFHDITLNVDFDNFGSGNGDVIDSEESAEAVVYGIGAGVTFIDHLNFKLEYELMDLDNVEDAETLWVTGAWRF